MPSSLVSLATDLLAQAKEIDAILEQNNISQTSFEIDTLESLPDSAQRLRLELLDNVHNLRQLIRGARLSGLDIAFGWIPQVILRIIWRYKLASAVPIDGSATYHEISIVSGLSEPLANRTIRAAINLNMFDEREPGRVSHTAITRLLATDQAYYQSVGLQVEDLGPASMRLIEAWQQFGADGRELNQNAFSLDNNGRPLFAILSEDPERAHRFDEAMKYSLKDRDISTANIVETFDWSKIDVPGSQLIDLGGGLGQISQILAQYTQNIGFVVQDLPHIVERGRHELPSHLSNRISFEQQDFMQPQAPRGGQLVVYLISRCLHNWSDYHCLQILRSLIPGLKKGSKILIWDEILDERPTKQLSKKYDALQDIIMATVSNGKDRTATQFERILEMSDPRFSVERVAKPTGSNLGLVQVAWNPDD